MGYVLTFVAGAIIGGLVMVVFGFMIGCYAAGQHLAGLLNEAGLNYEFGTIEPAPEWHPAAYDPDFDSEAFYDALGDS